MNVDVDEAVVAAAIALVQARETKQPKMVQEQRFLALSEAVGKRMARDLLAVQDTCPSVWPLL